MCFQVNTKMANTTGSLAADTVAQSYTHPQMTATPCQYTTMRDATDISQEESVSSSVSSAPQRANNLKEKNTHYTSGTQHGLGAVAINGWQVVSECIPYMSHKNVRLKSEKTRTQMSAKRRRKGASMHYMSFQLSQSLMNGKKVKA